MTMTSDTTHASFLGMLSAGHDPLHKINEKSQFHFQGTRSLCAVLLLRSVGFSTRIFHHCFSNNSQSLPVFFLPAPTNLSLHSKRINLQQV